MIGANRLALALAIKRRPKLPHLALPQIGITPPPAVARVAHPGLAIGFLGRLVPERGLDLLFRACVGLAGKWTLTVMGTGPSQEELEALAERLGISARVSWLGALPREAVDQVWPRLDCLVFPARTTQRWVATTARPRCMPWPTAWRWWRATRARCPKSSAMRAASCPRRTSPHCRPHCRRSTPIGRECERLGAAARRRIMDEFSDGAIAGKTLEFLALVDACKRLTSGDLERTSPSMDRTYLRCRLAVVTAAILGLELTVGIATRWGADSYSSTAGSAASLPDQARGPAAEPPRTGGAAAPAAARIRAHPGSGPLPAPGRGLPRDPARCLMSGADTTSVTRPGPQTFDAARALGILSDTEADSLAAQDSIRAISDSLQQVLDSLQLVQADSARADSLADSVRVLQGRGLKLFGLETFRRTTTRFQASQAGPVDDNYRLGSGDVLVLILTGDVEQVYTLNVNREGFIVIPKVGRCTSPT